MEMKIHKKTCPLCGKEFSSYSKKQVDWNYITHMGACKKLYIRTADKNPSIGEKEQLAEGKVGSSEKEVGE